MNSWEYTYLNCRPGASPGLECMNAHYMLASRTNTTKKSVGATFLDRENSSAYTMEVLW